MTNHQKIRLNVEGMTCANCALGIRKTLEKKGLENVNVSFANSEAAFDLHPKTSIKEAIDSIERLGFEVIEDASTYTPKTYLFGWSLIAWKLFICVLFTIPLLLGMFNIHPILSNPILQFCLALPVYLIGLQHFGLSAFHSIKSGVPNMDVLIIIGASAAFFYSLTGLVLGLGGKYLFWETAATIITLVLLGNLIEHRAVKQTTSAIKELLRLQPAKAKQVVLDEKGAEQIVEIESKNIKVGQQFLVNTGDKVPADGKVIWGTGAANEAMMTGESLLVDKQIDTDVIGGTILELGSIKIEVTKVGKDSALAQIIELVKNAQSNQPPIQKLADRISAVFVPVVLGISAVTFVVWYYLLNAGIQDAMLTAVAVLVVACPCAMGLATPTALAVGIGRAARNGILIKGGNTLEVLAKTKTVVFDKTGTLTTGLFSVDKFHSEIQDDQFKSLLLGLERYSTHPIAKSIVRTLEVDNKPMAFSDVQELKGLGIMGKDIDGNTYMAGSHSIAAEFTDEKDHAVYVLRNGELIGWVDMNDNLRPDAAQCVRSLQENDVKTILLSGDQADKTEYAAKKIGISTFYANKLPEE